MLGIRNIKVVGEVTGGETVLLEGVGAGADFLLLLTGIRGMYLACCHLEPFWKPDGGKAAKSGLGLSRLMWGQENGRVESS